MKLMKMVLGSWCVALGATATFAAGGLTEGFKAVDVGVASQGDGLDGVTGGMAAATVPDPGSPLGIGRMGFCGIGGEDGWIGFR